MLLHFDPTVPYDGPKAEVASLTGSPLWGHSVNEVIQTAQARGWTHHESRRIPTPYGLGPLIVHLGSPSGRSVLWIPSYGMVRGEDWQKRGHAEKSFWILWQAQVRMLLVGGTSGITDWRQDDQAIYPGDAVLPWSFRTREDHRGLPGTEHESFWPEHDLLLDRPFCPDGAAFLSAQFQEHMAAGRIRRLHTPAEARVALIMPDSLTFETDYDILMWLSLNKMASELTPKQPPVASLHGDCVNPILARRLGIHLLYYHLVANYAQGLRPDHDIAGSIHQLYTQAFPQVALDLELTTLDQAPIPAGDHCACTTSNREAPPVFSQAMTQSGTTG